jgi:UDP-glucose:(glucosyl)LPS alpha-1,2-glucosyltransferase
MTAIEENDVSINANGGTEITKRTLAKFIHPKFEDEFQIIPSRVRNIDEKRIRVYWQHDLAEDPEVNHLKDENSRNRFQRLVFSSNWQLQDFNTKLGLPLDDSIQVIETPIEPIPFVAKPTDKINLIYFSTPQRGLDLLVPVYEKLAEKYDNIHLDVFSSFKIYGWDEADKQFEPTYDKIRNHPKMTYHGFAKQEQLREALQKAHILAYPNIWKETSCRVLIESMSAGLMCVHPNLAALPDTSGGLTTMYQFNENVNKHANIFLQYLDHAINVVNTESAQNYLKFVKTYADSRFDIKKISSQWNGMLEDLLQKYPTDESRKIPSKMFVYRTT